jgi:hypothetical protein
LKPARRAERSEGFIIAAKYGSLLAERNLAFLNLGVSSNRVSDLQDQ